MDNQEPRKPINRIATPIKVDQYGNKIEDNNVTIKQPETIKKHNTKVSSIVVIILIIIAIIVAFLFYLIIPLYISEMNRPSYNDAPSTTTTQSVTYEIHDTYLNDLGFVNAPGDYPINNDFTISLLDNGSSLDILVNNMRIASANNLLSKIGFVDDLIMIITQDNTERTTKLYAIDKLGNIVYELYNITGMDGLVLMRDNSSVIFNNGGIVVMTSRVRGSALITDNTYGTISGVDICNTDELNNYSISPVSPALSNYIIEYQGNHHFTEPQSIYTLTIEDYIKQNNLCQ